MINKTFQQDERDFYKKLGQVRCDNCNEFYKKSNNRQKFCGSKRDKIGCSYLKKKERSRNYHKNNKYKYNNNRKTEEYRAHQRKISKEYTQNYNKYKEFYLKHHKDVL